MAIKKLVIVTGEPGSGQTTVTDLLAIRNHIVPVSAPYCRPPREGEVLDRLVEFVTTEEFNRRERARQIIEETIHDVETGGVKYKKGVMYSQYWAQSRGDTDFLLANFGRFSPIVKHRYAPKDMQVTTVYLWGNDENRAKLPRFAPGSERMKKVEFWRKLRFDKGFDYVFRNNGLPERLLDIVENIEKIAGVWRPVERRALP